jgi:hypothetical protein
MRPQVGCQVCPSPVASVSVQFNVFLPVPHPTGPTTSVEGSRHVPIGAFAATALFYPRAAALALALAARACTHPSSPPGSYLVPYVRYGRRTVRGDGSMHHTLPMPMPMQLQEMHQR